MNKPILIAIFLLFFLLNAAESQVGVGVWPARTELEVLQLKKSFVQINFFNPTDKKIKLKINFVCKNCEEEVNLLGIKLKIEYYLDFSLYPSEIELEKINLNESNKVVFGVSNPVLFAARIKTDFFGNKIGIPAAIPIFDKKIFNGVIIGETVDGAFKVQVTSNTLITIHGINTLLFFIVVISILLTIVFIYSKLEKY